MRSICPPSSDDASKRIASMPSELHQMSELSPPGPPPMIATCGFKSFCSDPLSNQTLRLAKVPQNTTVASRLGEESRGVMRAANDASSSARGAKLLSSGRKTDRRRLDDQCRRNGYVSGGFAP